MTWTGQVDARIRCIHDQMRAACELAKKRKVDHKPIMQPYLDLIREIEQEYPLALELDKQCTNSTASD